MITNKMKEQIDGYIKECYTDAMFHVADVVNARINDEMNLDLGHGGEAYRYVLDRLKELR